MSSSAGTGGGAGSAKRTTGGKAKKTSAGRTRKTTGGRGRGRK